MAKPDLIIVGAGLTGATIARLAIDANYRPLIIERRGVVGGNIRDEIHPATGLRYNLYGPHYFRTNSDKVWNFVNRFSDWRPFSAEVMTFVDDRLEHWPPNREYVKRQSPTHAAWSTIHSLDNFESVALSKMPQQVYEKMVKPYTEKQWGLKATELLPELASRFQIREDSSDHRLTTHKYQALPTEGYGRFVERMIEDAEIYFRASILNLPSKNDEIAVFTGPIDELFGEKFGRLSYRSQKREVIEESFPWIHLGEDGTTKRTMQINVPDPKYEYIRRIDWDFLNPIPTARTLVTYETPYTPTDFDHCEYPVPTASAKVQYELYRAYAEAHAPNIILAGRLAEYRYLDMDQAIARAMKTWEQKVLPRLREK